MLCKNGVYWDFQTAQPNNPTYGTVKKGVGSTYFLINQAVSGNGCHLFYKSTERRQQSGNKTEKSQN